MRLKLIALALGLAFLLLTGFRPGTLPYHPGAPYSDAVISHLPAAQFLRESVLQDGVFPLWRETIMAGQPFAANPLNKTAYPLQWLALLLPAPLHLDLMILLHLFLAGAGMWVWARSYNLSEAAAVVSALSYALAPRLIGHTGAGHLDLLYALAWFPWLMWSMVMVLTDLPSRRALVLYILLVALFAALILLADVRLTLFAYTLAGAYALYSLIRLKKPRRLWRFVPVALLAMLLSASVIVPLLGWSPYLSRAALTPGEAGVFSVDPLQTAFGLVLPSGSAGGIETYTYLGLPVLVLAIIGAVTARRWFWVAAAVMATLYAFGYYGFLWTALVQLVPALLWFRVPSRAWFVVALIAPLLAGYGVQYLIDHPPTRGRLLALIGTVVALMVGIFMALNVPSVNGLAIAIGGAGISLILLLAFAGRLRAERLAFALLLVIFLDLTLVGRGWLEWRTQEAWLPPAQVRLAERLIELNANRIYSPTYSLQQQVAEEYHLRLFGGVDPFQLTGIVEAIKQGGGIVDQPFVPVDGYSVIQPPIQAYELAASNQDAEPNATLLGQWGVTHVVSAYPIDATALYLMDEIDGMYIYGNMSAALTPRRDWLPDWDGLPDAPTVEALNNQTAAAALVSGVALFGVVLVLLVLAVPKVTR